VTITNANLQKIRFGAPDLMWLFNTTDLGLTTGGAELDYNPTVFQVEVDQSILPAKGFHTKEEVNFTVGLVQTQATVVAMVMGYPLTAIVTQVAGAMATATGLTVTNGGASGSTTYTYAVVAFNSNGDGMSSGNASNASGPATLTSVNYELITWVGVVGAVGYKIVRIAGGSTTGLIGTVYFPLQGGATLTFNDTGLTGTNYTAGLSNPAFPNSDSFKFGGTVGIQQGPFDFAVPKNDGTSNHWRGHLNNVYSSKAIKIDAKRDKPTELAKLTLTAMADYSQAVGNQAGFFIEEY
jgi:hypothetical protein